MRKTFGITKYESRWQLLRARIKGKHNDDLSYKFSLVLSYFKEDPSYNRWERVFNWAEGLLRGLKDEDKRIHTAAFLDELNQLKPQPSIIDDISENYNVLFNADIRDITLLWKDLFKMNKDWLLKGYFHKECNAFLDTLSNVLSARGVDNIKGYSNESLHNLRLGSKNIKNVHNFFF